MQNKILSVGGLVKKTDYDAKIKDIGGTYFTTADYNKLTSDILDVTIKQKELVNKSEIDKNLINISKETTSNKTRHIKTDKKVTDLTEKVAEI